ncbi:MAG: AAA family ATPase, partial [Lachnoclostridium sp.]|nr:AAA family ATPase [Lachnoclostridium sp.]
MKIRRIGYENFRAFKNHGDIIFSIDGKVNIIYGGNGAGKTTLHQLFQWVFYNHVSFNKSSSDKMYNLEFEDELSVGENFSVIGEIEFEHDGRLYLLRREWKYQKKLKESVKTNERVTLSYKTVDFDWERQPGDVSAFIEKVLPSGLSTYFFFDGERMITDLMEKGQDSSRKLKKALYSILNLNLYEKASRHIGSTDLKTSVIGKLYISRTGLGNQGAIDTLRINIENATGRIEETEARIESGETDRNNNAKEIQEISEKIGGAKTRAEYESIRKSLKMAADSYGKQIEEEQHIFGERLVENYPKILVSRSVMLAKKKLKNKLDTETLIKGLDAPLITELLNSEDRLCICGKKLDEDAVLHLKHFLKLLPSDSYKGVYDQFTYEAETIAQAPKYDLTKHIRKVLELKTLQREADNKIQDIDNELKVVADIQWLVDRRRGLETENRKIEADLRELRDTLSKLKIYLNKQKRDFDSETASNSNNALINQKIEIMKIVKQYFDNTLVELAREYSKKLCIAIQKLLETMLTTKRSVAMSEDFLLRVYDNFN